eukprot:c12660_g1_i1.p1 GENE.c12660_g1_i1~~c12660_g1_i1.p1  ORF type:complete len:352 (+),score=103.51 c12660_g1_i1:77-1132(+)
MTTPHDDDDDILANIAPAVADDDDDILANIASADNVNDDIRTQLEHIGAINSPAQGQPGEGTSTSEDGNLPLEILTLGMFPKQQQGDGIQPNSWAEPEAPSFVVRGPHYETDRVKIPSEKSFYECVSVDLLVSPNKPTNSVFPRLNLPEYPPHSSSDCVLPSRLIFVLKFPRYCPSMMGPPNDGDSGVCIGVFDIRPETVEAANLAPHLQSSAMRLLISAVEHPQEFLQHFKFIIRLPDQVVDEITKEYMGWTTAWLKLVLGLNGKPVLARDDIAIAMHDNGRTMEVQYDFHVGMYASRYAVYFFKDMWEKFVMEVGVVLEGRGEANLPEQILACWRVAKPTMANLKHTRW